MTDFKKIPDPPDPATLPTATLLQSGPPLNPILRLVTYTPEEWESFIGEWVSAVLKKQYTSVQEFAASGDRGIDVAGFVDDKMLQGVWDNYQCKRFAGSVSPSGAWPEIGKILWYSFTGYYNAPRAHYFVAPRGIGTKLAQLLAHADNLKAELKKVWAKSVADKITDTQTVSLEGAFEAYVDKFDFSIFKAISPRQITDQHRQTPFFLGRFGGALPARPIPAEPPEEIQPHEQKYVQCLLSAYADHTKQDVLDTAALSQWKPLKDHLWRQRESFYQAESLRVFVREKVEPGTFESLQDEVYSGVVDTAEGTHADGYECVKAVMLAAQNMALDAHPLGPSAFTKDRHGICHQLANEDRLKWTK